MCTNNDRRQVPPLLPPITTPNEWQRGRQERRRSRRGHIASATMGCTVRPRRSFNAVGCETEHFGGDAVVEAEVSLLLVIAACARCCFLLEFTSIVVVPPVAADRFMGGALAGFSTDFFVFSTALTDFSFFAFFVLSRRGFAFATALTDTDATTTGSSSISSQSKSSIARMVTTA